MISIYSEEGSSHDGKILKWNWSQWRRPFGLCGLYGAVHLIQHAGCVDVSGRVNSRPIRGPNATKCNRMQRISGCRKIQHFAFCAACGWICPTLVLRSGGLLGILKSRSFPAIKLKRGHESMWISWSCPLLYSQVGIQKAISDRVSLLRATKREVDILCGDVSTTARVLLNGS